MASKTPANINNSFAERWHHELAPDGHTQVSNYFLAHYHRLSPDLTHGEAMFVIHLMQHKWDEKAPFPSYATLAKRMTVSVKTARRYAISLAQKKYLHRELRVGATNRFYLDRLIEALVNLRRKDAGLAALKPGEFRRKP